MQENRPLVYIIAGEPSGDRLGAGLVNLLNSSDIDVAGIGGEHMQAQGLKKSLFPMEELSIMGVWGILKRFPQLLNRIHQTVEDIKTRRPDVVLTIDSPEFSFRVHKKLRQSRVGNSPHQAHWVAPTVWAWRPGRAAKISHFLDHLFCLYPFEPPLFEKHGLSSTFVGHPVVSEPLGDGSTFRQTHGIASKDKLLCVLPGSRSSEIETLLPIFSSAVEELFLVIPSLKVVIPTVSKHFQLVRDLVSSWEVRPVIVKGDENRHNAFAASNAALAASGTVSMELAHAGVPMAIAYKIGPFPRGWMKLILRTRWVCMVNILLGRNVVPELLQTDCTAPKCVQAMRPLLEGVESQSDDLSKAMLMLQPPSGGSAQKILDVLPIHANVKKSA